MSVMPIDHEVFQKVAEAITFNKTSDGMQVFNYSWDDVKIIVNAWYLLNDLSYCERYGDEPTNINLHLSDFDKVERIDNVQLLKYLECIDYNIELEKPSMKAQNYISTLNEMINTLKNLIIAELTAYQEANWSRY